MGACCSRNIVNEGQAAGVWHNGHLAIYRGPAVVRPGCKDIFEWLTVLSADEHQYLEVKFLDGHTEHIPGPTSFLQDPTKHKSVQCKPAVSIDEGELMVVMRKKGEAVERVIIRGPCMHVPTADEVTHEFVWHGSDPSNPAKKVPGKLRFTKLRTIPDQMYVSVPEVRTSDDALLVINLMIFFELANVEMLLSRSHDPIADMINAATADVIAFTAVLSYEMFLEKTDMLNNLEAYPQLVNRAKGIGYSISKVVYRGYHATDKLQLMHDDAISARTQLRLEAETEEQAQRLADLKLAKESERQRKKQEMQRQEIEHTNQLSRMQHEEKLTQENRTREAEVGAQRAANAEQLAFFRSLKELGVDLTQYLTSQNPRPDKLIQITSEQPGANVHVHANSQGKKK